MANRSCRGWTDDEDRFIAANPGFDDADLMVLLGRPYRQVHPRRLSVLVSTGRVTEDEADSMYVPMRGMPRHRRPATGRERDRRNLIENDRAKLAHGIRLSVRHWTPEEDEIVLASELPDELMAAMIGRTVGAIRERRRRIRRERRPARLVSNTTEPREA